MKIHIHPPMPTPAPPKPLPTKVEVEQRTQELVDRAKQEQSRREKRRSMFGSRKKGDSSKIYPDADEDQFEDEMTFPDDSDLDISI